VPAIATFRRSCCLTSRAITRSAWACRSLGFPACWTRAGGLGR